MAGDPPRRVLPRRSDQEGNLDGIDMALWDIKGKAFGVPIYKRLGGPTRDRVRVYGRISPETGVNAMKTQLRSEGRGPIKYVEGQKYVDGCVEYFKALRQKHGPGVDIGVEFHGEVQPPTAMLLIKALEPDSPWFYEEVVQALNMDIMAELARKTHIPITTGERIFTKWGFKEILEKRAATILQPDPCYAGGITELKIIAGMTEAYYTPLAPHNPQGSCSLAGPADRRVHPQLPHSGTRRQRIHGSPGETVAAGQERTPPVADRSGSWHYD